MKWLALHFGSLSFGSRLDAVCVRKKIMCVSGQANKLERFQNDCRIGWMNCIGERAEGLMMTMYGSRFFLAPEQLKARLKRRMMAAHQADPAPGLTVLNLLWWHMVDPLQPQLDHMVQIYWNSEGYLKTQRSKHHYAFHALAPAGSERWGTHGASLAMAALTRDYYRSTGYAFTQNTRHALMEGFYFWLQENGHHALWEYALEGTNLCASLQENPWYQEEGAPHISSVADLLVMRRSFVGKLRRLQGW